MSPIDHTLAANQPPGDWALIDEQRDFLVVAKPERMLSVPGIGPDKQDCLITRVQMEFPEARIVHRLDWDTSGLLVLARNARAHSFLSKAFADRRVDKTYVALIDESLEPAEGLIDLPIGKDPERRPRYRIDPERGRPSQTRYRVAATEKAAVRVILEPITGRSHQLRVHLLAQGRPIQGDTLYHPEGERHDRLMLHAMRLAFPDPEHPTKPMADYELDAPF
ncbi:RluA family pseudouridine synthase [Guyparkeria hydrothermalis]|uniref:RluA family pseudouridine synthase n=1 Tax=Guyparkeria hydrothermalis TaxID=923 RepID=UPI00202254D2|nr:RluA family pseudouridine synthase [Guyparkeria hydrothermalis]MCL7744817.1 RluA family pseudouridine synthase [Guyparkeria hydrothermalis]